MRGVQSFYRDFYGHEFFRHFRRPPDLDNKKFRIQFALKNSKNLLLHVLRNSGHHPCFTHVYDHGSWDNLKRGNSRRMVLDRAFFDFDVSNTQVKKIKNLLLSLRRHGPVHERDQQEELKEKIRELIINDNIAKKAIDEAKDFSMNFKELFGKEPILFFSGCKGAHAYTFFRASGFKNLNRAGAWFAENIKKSKSYECLDLAVNLDALARLSRTPYSKHQLTGLTVVPFSVEDSYDEIMEKSINPQVEAFSRMDFTSNFHEHLKRIDLVESYNAKVEKTRENKEMATSQTYNSGLVNDHRTFFRSIMGTPEREYPEKEYVMYRCPLKSHEDRKPSFMVHKNGYQCYGCQKKGNYWQFLKDYYGWRDEDVKSRLKNFNGC
ncbi:MAG: CHC2 zinc finger domain-containing protein [Methanobacteriaceae archaeon]|nr:CHC2 zinc finger domain-containing protein [Methanobacteriaceae archaeon]MDZ4171752.1 CHC2 zinc finger domain-containing protein [Methanobacteriaceae archaeon]